MLEMTLIQKIAIWALPILFAITIHEVAHGWVASKLGDQTARFSGRLTLNPLKHIDLVGTILLPAILLMVSSMIFGWAKPVPVDPRNFAHPRRDMAMVAAAGPLSNLLMAGVWAGIAKLDYYLLASDQWFSLPLIYMGKAGIIVNVVLAVVNFIPIPPLDGGKILYNVLPGRMAWYLAKFEPYAIIILLILFFSGILSLVFGPVIIFLNDFINSLFGLGY